MCVDDNGCGCAPGFVFNDDMSECICGKCGFTSRSLLDVSCLTNLRVKL